MTATKTLRVPATYRDSVVLMQLSRDLTARPGIIESAVLMGTPANLDVLRENDLLTIDTQQVTPADLIIAVHARTESAAVAAIDWAAEMVRAPRGGSVQQQRTATEPGGRLRWHNIPDAARLALISTPGHYAAAEAWQALRAGRHVMLFSNHVSVEDEVALKQAGRQRRLLVMGPECGTALIGGVPLGFANRVRRGSIGLVAASGSGLQEVTSLIDRLGAGVSHAIGTGGRDLSAAVGGAAMLQGIDVLDDDDDTAVLLLLSKPPDPDIMERVLARLDRTSTPAIVCFLGADTAPAMADHVRMTTTLEAAAYTAVDLATGQSMIADEVDPLPTPPTGTDGPPLLRGLFAGGTLAYEAMIVLQQILVPIWSNVPLDPTMRVDGHDSAGHVCLDLGTETYTATRPHPMIDGSYRVELLAQAARDPRVGVILFDVVLGLGVESDPAGTLGPAIDAAQQQAATESRSLVFIASVTGTDRDPQSRADQTAKLRAHGVYVASSNAAAARAAAAILTQ